MPTRESNVTTPTQATSTKRLKIEALPKNNKLTNGLPSNGSRFAYFHHFEDGEDNIHKDEREYDAFESTDEELSNETEPLESDLLAWCQGGE